MATVEDDHEWGDQLNALIDSQIEAAQALDDDLLEEVIKWDRRTCRARDDTRG